MNVAAVVISVLSLVVAYLSFRKSSAVQKRQLEIEEQRERDRLTETKKAYLTARLVRESTGRKTFTHYFEVRNEGACEARDIEIELDGVAAKNSPVVPDGQPDITYLGPRSEARYVLALGYDHPPPKMAELRWTDDSGEPGYYRTTLTL